ncbi:MAG: hypothetical protein LBL46_00160 [Rickettsiales bacterium]|jgi:hypothetical protein|nr:hypothetical protein [Rickettsiales bacterium]
MAKKEIQVIERDGAKFVEKKASWVKKVKTIFLVCTAVWFGVAAWYPLHIKASYSEQIKKSIVVSMFFDLQQGIAEQYGRLMNGVKGSLDKIKDKVDFDKPVNAAVDKIKLAQTAGDSVKKQSDGIKKQLASLNQSLALAKRFGVKTGGIDSITKEVDGLANAANNEVGKINSQLDGVKKTLTKAAKEETDKMFDGVNKTIDDEIRGQLDKATGGMSAVLLTKYNVKSIAPWRPSTWKISTQIYAELEKSSKSTVQIIMSTINGYFGFVAWGLVILAWLAALFIWFSVKKKVAAITKPFIVCPKCGNAFSDKRTALGILKIFKPWTWL